ncbi:aminoglycoside phosphotransferase family protein [Jiangella rhizosphaerae]|uniref:Aminoglycoside phosphotransferase family protein n=1 Tax=Jiangella rhizosphaerae TaxID=2293569 RepID=A0A418KT94_9ACTN|nr:aminoglycoside phosphotransferase family protein [Jiangella rhizosphaerae]RIQ28189.1 aminoglycoside phosphotransferase family protein [Jiangella rhizosphaerae]
MPAASDAVRSLEWTAAIERTARSLPSPGRVARLRRRYFFHDNRIAFSVRLDPASPFPSSGVFVDQRTGASVLVAGDRPRVRSAAAADVVVAGAMRTAEQLRFRAFYVTETHQTLVVQQRVAAGTPTPLVAGSAHQRALAGRTPFAVPRVLESGLAGRGLSGDAVADWLVEEAVDGAAVRPEDAEDTVHELLTLLAETWQRLGVSHEPLGAEQRSRALAAFTILADDPPPGLWPAGLDPQATLRRARALLDDARPLTVGLSHGDPGLGNVLRTTDGRLALVDWEDAGYRPLAHDVLKVLMSAPDPRALAAALDTPASLRPAVASAGAVPWRLQIAVAELLFLSGWRNRYFRAVKRGSVKIANRRMQTMLTMLDDLLP